MRWETGAAVPRSDLCFNTVTLVAVWGSGADSYFISAVSSEHSATLSSFTEKTDMDPKEARSQPDPPPQPRVKEVSAYGSNFLKSTAQAASWHGLSQVSILMNVPRISVRAFSKLQK